MVYNVYKGEYPFDVLIGQVYGETSEQALENAIKQYGHIDRHPVVGPVTNLQ